MPWTFAHPAAVLPLRRFCPTWLSFPALLAGSVIPDGGYYLGRLDLAAIAHTAPGLFTICLPAGLVMLALLWRLGRIVPALLPQPHRGLVEAALRPPTIGPQLLLVLPLSVLLGAASHLAWDSLTHASGALVIQVPVLRLELFEIGGRLFHLYNVLQHASTVAGVAVLVIAYRHHIQRAAASPKTLWDAHEPQRWRLLLVVCAFALMCGAALALARSKPDAINLSLLLVRTVVYATAAFVLTYLAVAFVWLRTHKVADN